MVGLYALALVLGVLGIITMNQPIEISDARDIILFVLITIDLLYLLSSAILLLFSKKINAYIKQI